MLRKIKKEDSLLVLFCIVIVSISLLPFFCDYIHVHLGMDTIYHINRIEGYAKSIKEFNFFPRVYPDKVNGYGYVGPTFYSDISLLIPAILYNLNIPIIICFKINVFIISLLSALSMAFSAKKITGNIKISFLSTVLYIFSQYRLMNIYSRGALGGLYGFIFYPLIIYALYQMFEMKKPQTICLIIAFTGLLLSHNISFFIGVFLFGISIIFFIKRINKEIFLSIINAAVVTLGIGCFYWAPLLEMTFTQDFVFEGGLNRTFELKSAAVGIDKIFKYTIYGFNDHTNKISVGILFIISPIVLFISRFKEKNIFFNYLLGLGFFMIFMTTYYFPWDYFGIFATIQFPWRLLTIAGACLSMATSKIIVDHLSKKIQYIFMAIIFGTCIIYIFQISKFEKTFDDLATYQEIVTTKTPDKCLENNTVSCYIASWELAQGNYLNKLSLGREKWERVITNVSHEVISEEVFSDNGVTSFEVKSSIPNEYIVFPVNYYLGMKAEAVNTNNQIKVMETSMDLENAQVRVRLNDPAFRGIINVWYEGTFIQKYSIGISYIFILSCVLYYLGLKIKEL